MGGTSAEHNGQDNLWELKARMTHEPRRTDTFRALELEKLETEQESRIGQAEESAKPTQILEAEPKAYPSATQLLKAWFQQLETEAGY